MNSLTSLEEQNLRFMMWLSLNDLELLPGVYKAFFDLIISEFADMEATSALGKKRSLCGCEALLNTAVISVTHLGTCWAPPRHKGLPWTVLFLAVHLTKGRLTSTRESQAGVFRAVQSLLSLSPLRASPGTAQQWHRAQGDKQERHRGTGVWHCTCSTVPWFPSRLLCCLSMGILSSQHPQPSQRQNPCCRCDRLCPLRLNPCCWMGEWGKRNLSAAFWYSFYQGSEVHLEGPNQLGSWEMVRAENISPNPTLSETSLIPLGKVQHHCNSWHCHEYFSWR